MTATQGYYSTRDEVTKLISGGDWTLNPSEIACAINTLENIRAAAADDFDGEDDRLDLTVAIDVLEAVYRAIQPRGVDDR